VDGVTASPLAVPGGIVFDR